MVESIFEAAVRKVHGCKLGLSGENKIAATECLLLGIEPEVVLALLSSRMNDGNWRINQALKGLIDKWSVVKTEPQDLVVV